jgi:hypothetical protein
LEKQEKQLKIVIEELKLIHSNHERAILKCKKRLQLKGTAEKVIAAIRNKNSKSVTGSDMACLLNEI